VNLHTSPVVQSLKLKMEATWAANRTGDWALFERNHWKFFCVQIFKAVWFGGKAGSFEKRSKGDKVEKGRNRSRSEAEKEKKKVR